MMACDKLFYKTTLVPAVTMHCLLVASSMRTKISSLCDRQKK